MHLLCFIYSILKLFTKSEPNYKKKSQNLSKSEVGTVLALNTIRLCTYLMHNIDLQ